MQLGPAHARRAGILGLGLALTTLCAQGTEFGGVVNVSTNAGFVKLSREFKTTGDLTWLRTSSAALAGQGFDQVSIVPLPTSPGKEPRSARWSPDLLAVYWLCRTNLPVFPNVQQAWEVGNEPDFFWIEDNPDRVAAVAKAAYWGIKAGNPKAAVLLPSLAFVPDKYPRELAANGVYPFLDGYNLHYYGWAQDFWPSLDLHRQFMARDGWDLPIWVTEAGDFQLRQDRNTEPEDLARQQVFHERLAITAFAASVDYYLPFILTPWVEVGSDLSLVRLDFTPRPALESYLFFSRYLRGCRPCYRIWHRPTQSEIGVVLVEPDGNWFTALWTPYRWKDFELPTEEQRPRNRSSVGRRPPAAPKGGRMTWDRRARDGTALPLALVGRRPPAAPLADLTTARRDGAALPGSWSRCTVEGSRGAVQPSADGSLPPVPQPSTAGQDSPTDPTALGLDFSFPPETGWVTLGLRGESKPMGLSTVNCEVSASRNFFLRTPAHRFEIRDCEWLPMGERRGGIEDLRSPIGDSGIASRSRKLQLASRSPHGPPSPVVLQLLYDPFAIAVDKPSQTYQFNPRLPIPARLEIYNFSAMPQSGRWWPDLPEGWRIELTAKRGAKSICGGAVSRLDGDDYLAIRQPAVGRRPPAAPKGGRMTWDRRARDGTALPLALVGRWPPAAPLAAGKTARGKRAALPDARRVCGSFGDRPADPAALRVVIPPMSKVSIPLVLGAHGNARAQIVFHWSGQDGPGDVCSTWLEADDPLRPANVLFPISGWCPAPEHPAQWQISSPDRDTVRLTLREEPEPGRNASIWLVVPDGMELRPNDVLRMQLRLEPSRPGMYFRVNFVTAQREVFRFTEDQPFGNYWTEWSSRLGDFGGTFWSHVGGECRVPVQQFRYMRLSFQDLVVADVVELREVGISR